MASTIVFDSAKTDRYDRSILRMPKNVWYRFDSVDDEALLRYLVSEYHRLKLIEFTISSDNAQFRKDSMSPELTEILTKKK